MVQSPSRRAGNRDNQGTELELYIRYTPEQKRVAVDYYLTRGRNLCRTVRSLGYPSRDLLAQWCKELAPEARKKRVSRVQYTKEQKIVGVIALETRSGSVREVAAEQGVSCGALYQWKQELLGREDFQAMPKPKDLSLPDDRDALIAELETLKKQVYRLQMEKDILEATAEILKKDPGVDRTKLRKH